MVGQKRVGREIYDSKSIFYFRYWFHVRYGDTKKYLYLLCTVHGVYCICKDESNHVLQEDGLCKRGCVREKVAVFPREKARNWIISKRKPIFAYRTALSEQCF